MNKQPFPDQFRQQALGYILAAFGFVAGLAWNDAIKALIDAVFPLGNGGLVAKFIYAVIVTSIVIFVTWIGVRIMKKPESSK